MSDDGLEGAGESRELTQDEQEKLAQLDEAIQKFEQQKRWSDMIRSILAKVDIVTSTGDKVGLLRQAGTMYLERSSNQAEAIKCFERLLELMPQDADAISRLKEMYEKRRDWEKLIRTMEREAALLPEDDQIIHYAEMAELATQRLRKPQVCIDLWQKVLDADADNPNALANLAQLYERARQWEPLAEVLERLVQANSEEQSLKQQLQKLGMIYADKIGDDQGAIRAFRSLLDLDPQDRRAQEQLKRRYVSLGAWDELESFYAANEQWDELIRILERQAEAQETSPDDRLALLFRAARLWEEKKEKPERAARVYEKIIASDPDNVAAAEALTPIYEGAHDARKLISVLEVRLAAAGDSEHRVELLRKVGFVFEERLRQHETAFEKYLEAFRLAPASEEARIDAERMAEELDAWDRLVSGYETAISSASDPHQAVPVRLSYAKTQTRLGQIDDAIAQYTAVYELESDNREAIEGLGELYLRTERYRDLLDVYARSMELEGDSEVRAQIAYKRAALLEDQLKDVDGAISAFENIVDDFGVEQRDACRELERLYEAQGKWQSMAHLLERRTEAGGSDDEELAALKFRLGYLNEMQLQDKHRSVELYKEVMVLVPEHQGARERLELLMTDDDVAGAAANVLEPVYETQGAWDEFVRSLRVQHRMSTDGDERLKLLTRIAETSVHRLADPDQGFDVYAEAFREAPSSTDTLARLEALAQERERFGALVELTSDLAAGTSDASLSRSLWIKTAELQDQQLRDPDAAVGAYRKVLQDQPGDDHVLSALEALFRREERWHEVVQVLRMRVDASDDVDASTRTLSEMARIQAELLHDPDAAIALQNEILELDDTSREAMTSLDNLLAAQGQWSALADNVERQLAIAEDDDEQVSLLLRLAELRGNRMGSMESAIEIYRDVLARDAENPVALGALQQMLESPEHQATAADILEPIYEANQDSAKLADVYEIQAHHAGAPDRRVELFEQIAKIREFSLGDLNGAFEAYARAFKEDPMNGQTRGEFERVSGALGAADAQASVYEDIVRSHDEADLNIDLLLKAADLRENQLGQVETAVEHFKQILRIDDRHEFAADALERLFQQADRYEELASVYETKAAMAPAASDQREYYLKSAAVYEDIIDQPERAVGVYEKVLEIDPEDVQTIDRLIELRRRIGEPEPLIAALERKAEVVDDVNLRKELFAQIGAVYEQHGTDPERAIDSYRRALDFDPDDVNALRRLDALHGERGEWREQRDVLERQAELAQEEGEQLHIRHRIGRLWHEHLEDSHQAVDIYRDVLSEAPDHQPTLEALHAMMNEGVEALTAAEILEPIYISSGSYQNLSEVREAQAKHTEHDSDKVDRLHQLGELYEVHLEDSGRAFDALSRALPLDSRNEQTLSSLERLAEDNSGWTDVVRLYDAEVGKLRESLPDDAVELGLRSAQISELHLEDVDGAIARYESVIDLDPTNVKAIEALDRLFEQTERWGDLAETLKKETAIAETPDQILGLQYRAAQIYEHRLGNMDQAIEQYREIVAAAPEYEPAVTALEGMFSSGVKPLEVGEVLEPLYRMQGNWERLLTVQEVQVENQPDPVERVMMMHRLAEIAEGKADDHARAFSWMQRALLEDPSHDHSLGEAERLSGIVDGWNELANTYANGIQSANDPLNKLELGRRLARVYESKLDDVERAEETYRFVLGVDEQDEESLKALDRIYAQHGAHQALAQVLRTRIAVSNNSSEQVELHTRLGRLLSEELAQTEEAITLYQRLLREHDSENAEAMTALESMYSRAERYPELFATYEQQLSIALGDSQQSEIFAKMAKLASDRLKDPERAVELWQRVLDLRGEDPEALNALGDIFAGQGNWRDLVDVLEREAAVAEDDTFRVQVYSDLARVWYEKLERERNAIENWERVLDIDPNNTYALFNIAEIHRASNQSHEQADTLRRIIDVGAATLEDADIVDVYMQLGHIYAKDLGQSPDAVEAYRNVLMLQPDHVPAMDALEWIFRQDGDWREAIEVIEQRGEVLEDPRDRVRQLIAATRLWEEELGDPDGASGAYGRVLAIEPMHDYAFDKLETLHREAGRSDSLIDLYISRIEASDNKNERIQLLRKAAEVYEKELDDGEQAFHSVFIAWTEDYTRSETVEHLERVTVDHDKWNELLTSANDLLKEEQDPQSQIAVCLLCAKWYGQDLDHPQYAIPYYERIRAIDPANAQAWWQLGDLYEKTQQWDNLAQTLARLVELTDDVDVKADTYVRMADLAEDRFSMRDEAEDKYRRALDLKPSHVGALEALERIYKEDGRANKLLAILERKAEASDDIEAVVAARLQVARHYEERGDDRRAAIQNYELALENAPGNLDALRGLERMYTAEGRHQDLQQVLERQYDVVTTERERIDISMRLATMWEEDFRKPEEAVARLEEVLEIDPLHEEALVSLERLYRQTQRWEDLVRTYDRHASATPDQAEKVRIFRELGDVHAVQLGEIEPAIDNYLNALGIDEQDLQTLQSLTRIYEKKGDHAAALETMDQLAKVIDEPSEQVSLKHRMGTILDQELGDRTAALEQFQTAIDLEPGHLPSLGAMRQIHIDSGDWAAAVRTLGLEVEYSESARVKAERLVDLGQIQQDRLEDGEAALATFEQARAYDPDNESALMPLVDAYTAQDRYDEALPLLQQLVQRSDRRESHEQHRLASMLGEVAAKMGQNEEAVRAYERAYQLDENDVAALKGLAGSYFHAGDWEKAFKYHQMLLVQHRDSLGRDEVTEIFYRLGVVKREQGEDKKARNLFDKALEEDSHFVPALSAMVELHTTEQDWESVLQYKKRILDVTDEPADRAAHLVELGDLWLEKLSDPEQAATAFADAIDIEPDNHIVLHKLLEAYQKSERWSDAIDIIDRVAGLDDRDEAKARYAYTAGVILRDKLEDEDGALERFNQALDLDLERLKPFEAINVILNKRKDWKALERAFRKMLHRVIGKGKTELEHNFWHNLGIIYRDRQQNFEAAAEAFKMAAQLKPDDPQGHQILAELFATMPDRTNDAIAEHQWLLGQDPNRLESYRALYKLYFDARAYDKAWCVARTLAYFKKADTEQQKFFEQYKQDPEIKTTARLTHEQWASDLMHPDQSLFISKIMEVIAPALRKAMGESDKKLKLDKRQQEDPVNPSLALSRQKKIAEHVLATIPVRLFIQKEVPGGLRDEARSYPPAIVTGYTLLSGYRPADLAFVVGRHLSYYRGEHFIRTMYNSHHELKTLLLAALRLAGSGPADPNVDAAAASIGKHLDQAGKDALRMVVKRFLDAGGKGDIKRWMQCVEVTALRAGMLLCNDVDTAVRMTQQVPTNFTADLELRDKVKEIVLFSVSEEYFRLREALGLQIQV